MAGLEQLKRAHVPQGGTLRISLEGGPILEIKNPSRSHYVVEHKAGGTREAQREELWAKLPDVLFPHVQARLNQHGYKVVGGEEISGEMTLMETESSLRRWIERAKETGVSNQEILNGTKELLKLVVIGASKMGEIPPLVKGINTEIEGLVDNVWGKRKPKH